MYKFKVFSSMMILLSSVNIYADFTYHTQLISDNTTINYDIKRRPIPPTPYNMSLPEFGQQVIQWATGIDGAKQRYENITASDVQIIQQKGTTLAMVQEWRDFYANEMQRVPANITAIYRYKLMQRIMELWSN